MDCYDENNEYYEDEVEDENLRTNLEDEDEEDVWDDSALIAAWDSAMKEYQNSHSIKANKTSTKNDTVSKAISASLNNEAMEEEEIESFAQQDIASALDEIEDEDASTSDSVKKTSVKERKQNVQRTSEQKIKETRQIKPQTTAKSSNLTSGRDTSYQPQTIATYSSYPHHIPGYYSYPPPSATSSTAPISLHSFGEQIKGTTDTQEGQEESKLSPTEEATTSHSNTNVNNSYYNGENYAAHYPPSAYGWYPNYYPPPPPPGPQPPIPPSQFYPSHSSSMPTDSNIPFTSWGPSKPTDMVPPMPGFDDEALTNLIMAWYYSGYYTGLYHGRKGR